MLIKVHKPVLLNEVVENIITEKDGIYVDATFGRGGHSKEILKRLGPNAKLLVIDKDLTAIEAAEELQKIDKRIIVRHGAFSRIKEFCDALNLSGMVTGVLLDLGASSPQFDEASRGFSFMREGPLDMRMDQTEELTASIWLQKATEKEIADTLRQYGEERFSRRIARAICKAQESGPIQTTTELVKIVEDALPRFERHKHPATRTFQALRIAVNNELDEINDCLEESTSVLKDKGRLVVIAFHSLEEQLVRNFLRTKTSSTLPRRLPVTENLIKRTIRVIGKAIAPKEEEIAENPRARSAKLYIMEKIS